VKLPPVIAVADGVQAFGQFNKVHRVLLKAYSFGGMRPEGKAHVGAAAGCDLLTLVLKNTIKRSQPAAAPTGFPFGVAWAILVTGNSATCVVAQGSALSSG
jgi:hypothetical protein